MNEEKLKEMGIEEANSELSDEEFEKWHDLREESLLESANENRTKWEKEDAEALDILINKDEEGMVEEIEHQGNEIKYILNMDRKQENIYSKIMNLESKENPNQEDRKRYKNLLMDFFAEIVTEFNEKEIKNADFSSKALAKQCYRKWGRLPFQDLIEEILLKFYEEKREKMDTVEKFR